MLEKNTKIIIFNISAFLFGTLLTVGLIIAPYLIPGRYGYQIGLLWPVTKILLFLFVEALILILTLWISCKLIKGASIWKEPRVIAGALLIAFVANTLYICLVDFFALKCGMRSLIALLGVPIIYGNLGSALGKTTLQKSMLNIFFGTLATMGAGFILVALIKGW